MRARVAHLGRAVRRLSRRGSKRVHGGRAARVMRRCRRHARKCRRRVSRKDWSPSTHCQWQTCFSFGAFRQSASLARPQRLRQSSERPDQKKTKFAQPAATARGRNPGRSQGGSAGSHSRAYPAAFENSCELRVTRLCLPLRDGPSLRLALTSFFSGASLLFCCIVFVLSPLLTV